MKDPAAFWKFLFMIGLLVVGFFIFFPGFSGHDLELTATVHNLTETSLEDEIQKILAELPPARYYVQEIRMAYRPDGTVRNLYLDLISQPNAKGKRVMAQVTRSKDSYEYRISYKEIENGIQNGDLDVADLHQVLTPYVLSVMIPQQPCSYVYVEGTPVLTQIDLNTKSEFYTVLDIPHNTRGLHPIKTGTGYPFNVTPMQQVSEGHESGKLLYHFLLNRQKYEKPFYR